MVKLWGVFHLEIVSKVYRWDLEIAPVTGLKMEKNILCSCHQYIKEKEACKTTISFHGIYNELTKYVGL